MIEALILAHNSQVAMLTIDPASRDEIEIVLRILNDAVRWLQLRGLPTWNPNTLALVVAESISRGDVYLARLDTKAIATLTVQWTDPIFWGDRPDDAGYIHKLAVARAAAGQEIGAQLLAWAERMIAEQGRQYARLDCHANNPGINHFYETAGYQDQGIVTVSGTPFRLYEKKLW